MIRQAAAVNQRPLTSDWRLTAVQAEKGRRTNVLDLFRSGNLTILEIQYYNSYKISSLSIHSTAYHLQMSCMSTHFIKNSNEQLGNLHEAFLNKICFTIITV